MARIRSGNGKGWKGRRVESLRARDQPASLHKSGFRALPIPTTIQTSQRRAGRLNDLVLLLLLLLL
jgi:hypothetical protein